MLFTIASVSDGRERWDRARIVVQSISSGERHTLVDGGSDGWYVATGPLLYARGGSVFAAPFDPAAPGVLTGARSVIEGVRRALAATTGIAHFATSASGDLIYIPGPARPATGLVLATADRSGLYSLLTVPAGRYVHTRASRDGARLAVDTDDGKEADVSTFDLKGTSALRRLTFGGRNRFPVWSPDGLRVAFQSDRDGDAAIFAQRVDGTGVERLTRPAAGEAHVPESWSPDGRHISFSVQKGSEYALWTLSTADGKATRFRDVVSTDPIGSAFSPDGRWIACHALPPGASATTSSSGVYVEPFPPTGALFQAPKVGRDFQPVWSSDGSELQYVGTTSSGQLAAVPVTSSAGITFGRPVTFPFTLTAGRLATSTRAFDVLPDGRFVGVVAESAGDRSGSTPEIRVVLNWYEELEQMVPHTGRR